jgi:hypothetical protein
VVSPYLTANTSRLRHRAQPVTAVWGNSRCLLWEPHGTHRYTVSIPYLTGNNFSATEPNRLTLCGETVAVCCENRTEHTDTLWAVRTSQETSRLRYRAQPVNAVGSPYLTGDMSRFRYRAQPVNAVWGNSRCLLWEPSGTHRYTVGSPYVTGNTLRLRCRAQPINAVWGNSRCLLLRTVGNTQIHCGQSVRHRKHITSPLQSPTG